MLGNKMLYSLLSLPRNSAQENITIIFKHDLLQPLIFRASYFSYRTAEAL